MTTLLLALTICATLFAATKIGGDRVATAGAGGIEPTRSDLRQGIETYRAKADRLRRNRCLPPRDWRSLKGMWRGELADVLWHTIRFRDQMLDRNWKACWRWYQVSGARCVADGEGAWSSATGNGYFGRFQADLNFQAAYGGNWLRRYGTANYWLPRYQTNMAWRGWNARGWQPWPNTARACGLI